MALSKIERFHESRFACAAEKAAYRLDYRLYTRREESTGIITRAHNDSDDNRANDDVRLFLFPRAFFTAPFAPESGRGSAAVRCVPQR